MAQAKGLDLLEEYGEAQDDGTLSDTAAQLMSRLKGLKRKMRKGIIEQQAAELERNQIRHAVLEVAGEIQGT